MRITLAVVGRARPGPERDLFEHYARRITDQGLGKIVVKEVEERRPRGPEALKAREAELLLGVLPAGARLWALDAGGRNLTSEAFAERLRTLRDEGLQDLAFAIGGAEGLAPSLLERADAVLALGSLTWPHLLVRGLLAEQLYRAQSILTGHPYHRG